MTYSNLSKRVPKHSYFCGWYYRCQSDNQTLAIIPSVHKTKNSAFCTVQVITDTHAFHVQFPYDDLVEDDDQIRIGNNRFGKSGVRWISTPPDSVLRGLFDLVFSPQSSMTLWGLFNIFHSCSAGTAFTVCITV